jgi:hypothetical protein
MKFKKYFRTIRQVIACLIAFVALQIGAYEMVWEREVAPTGFFNDPGLYRTAGSLILIMVAMILDYESLDKNIVSPVSVCVTACFASCLFTTFFITIPNKFGHWFSYFEQVMLTDCIFFILILLYLAYKKKIFRGGSLTFAI